MRVIVCLDDRGGMMFNGRRQSKDRVLIRDVVASLDGKPLALSPYSAPLFAETELPLAVSETFLDEAGAETVCFVEDRALRPYLDRIDRLVIYRWNRHYPSDLSLDLDPIAEGFHLGETSEFEGSSHKTVTKEIYWK